MTDAVTPRPSSPRGLAAAGAVDPWAATLALVGVLTVVRVAVLFATPLELYPDEAQYWLWSRSPAWGYFSKPPMIAWLIRATTAVGGDTEPWVRLSAPLLHGMAALAMHRAGSRLFDGRTAFAAAAVYALMPGVQVSSQFIATDAPLLAFLALAIWALAALWMAPRDRIGAGSASAAALGVALGLACLSKYAGLYLPAGLALHAVVDGEGRRRLWTPPRLTVALAVFAAVVAPNVAWNLANHLQTVVHTVADAGLQSGDPAPARGFDPRGPLGFLFGQLAVFGPLPFVLLALGGARALVRRKASAEERLLLAFTLPPLAVVLVEAALVRANANWAAAAYPAGSLLVAFWLRDSSGRRWLAGGLAVQAVIVALFAAATISPDAAHALHVESSLKRAKGWRAATTAVRAHLARTRAGGPVTALAVDDRFLFNALAYYGRNWIAAPGAPPLQMWVHEARPLNQAEATAPLTVGEGGRVAFAQMTWPRETRWDFRTVEEAGAVSIRLDAGHFRALHLFIGSGFAPRPRDRNTGLPIAP